MFSFMNMANNYESRKVDRYDGEGFFVSTVSVTDSAKPYETGISHKKYNNGHVIVVEEYGDIVTAKELPESLSEVGNNTTAKFVNSLINTNKVYPRTK